MPGADLRRHFFNCVNLKITASCSALPPVSYRAIALHHEQHAMLGIARDIAQTGLHLPRPNLCCLGVMGSESRGGGEVEQDQAGNEEASALLQRRCIIV
jgi:hypothetical protein